MMIAIGTTEFIDNTPKNSNESKNDEEGRDRIFEKTEQVIVHELHRL